MAGIVAHLLRGDLFNHEHFHVSFVMKERKYFGRKSEVSSIFMSYLASMFIERVINILEQPPHQFPVSRGLSRQSKNERKERDICRHPTHCLM